MPSLPVKPYPGYRDALLMLCPQSRAQALHRPKVHITCMGSQELLPSDIPRQLESSEELGRHGRDTTNAHSVWAACGVQAAAGMPGPQDSAPQYSKVENQGLWRRTANCPASFTCSLSQSMNRYQ